MESSNQRYEMKWNKIRWNEVTSFKTAFNCMSTSHWDLTCHFRYNFWHFVLIPPLEFREGFVTASTAYEVEIYRYWGVSAYTYSLLMRDLKELVRANKNCAIRISTYYFRILCCLQKKAFYVECCLAWLIGGKRLSRVFLVLNFAGSREEKAHHCDESGCW